MSRWILALCGASAIALGVGWTGHDGTAAAEAASKAKAAPDGKAKAAPDGDAKTRSGRAETAGGEDEAAARRAKARAAKRAKARAAKRAKARAAKRAKARAAKRAKAKRAKARAAKRAKAKRAKARAAKARRAKARRARARQARARRSRSRPALATSRPGAFRDPQAPAAGDAPAPSEAPRAADEPPPAPAIARSDEASCLRVLDGLGVAYKRVSKPGIAIGVQVGGGQGKDRAGGVIAGVRYHGYSKRPLVLDCSLVVSLARAAPYLRAHGIDSARYSSSYQRRKIRGSDRWSQHSFGLAIDIHELSGDGVALSVKDDYEQGLGDELDCIGQPLTDGGRALRTLYCQMDRSEQFRFILSPDYDDAHYNHFHVEALAWTDRPHRLEPAPSVGDLGPR